jgi:hypothetical protein
MNQLFFEKDWTNYFLSMTSIRDSLNPHFMLLALSLLFRETITFILSYYQLLLIMRRKRLNTIERIILFPLHH